uniref:Uncharacterized protein n=1 Tax=Siphoviridae sp. ct87j35 TaxID=2825356 RepID=A0A8S5V4I7_9CAUD|nr:MAG TPA: hypothetical protein [Siphoviridae sp. ct87j35]
MSRPYLSSMHQQLRDCSSLNRNKTIPCLILKTIPPESSLVHFDLTCLSSLIYIKDTSVA